MRPMDPAWPAFLTGSALPTSCGWFAAGPPESEGLASEPWWIAIRAGVGPQALEDVRRPFHTPTPRRFPTPGFAARRIVAGKKRSGITSYRGVLDGTPNGAPRSVGYISIQYTAKICDEAKDAGTLEFQAQRARRAVSPANCLSRLSWPWSPSFLPEKGDPDSPAPEH